MKRLILLLCLWPVLALADQPISLNMREIPVVSFAEATYKAILGRDFMISPEVIGLENRVTISIKSVDKAKLPKLLAEVLQSVGVRVRDEDGLIRLEKFSASSLSDAGAVSVPSPGGRPMPGDSTALPLDPVPPAPISYEVYRPQFRTVEYLQAVMRFAGIGAQNAPGGAGQQSMDAIVISGNDEKREKMRKLITELDQRPQVINVRAALVEFSNTTNDSLSLGGILSLLGGKLSITANAANTATNFARWKTGSIDVVLGAMHDDSRFTYRAQPSIRLVDGELGKLQVGSDVPVRGNLTITQSGQQVQATEYKPSGLVLSVLPRVLRDRIQAKVVQEVSSFTKTNTSGIDSPTLNKRLIETVVDSEDGEVIILAGLDEENINEGRSGLASWLPLAKSDDKRTTQLLVLLEFKRL